MYASKDTVWVSPDRRTRLSYDTGANQLDIVVDDVTVLTLTTSGVDATALSVGSELVPHGTPVANIADPSGGETEDAEARSAIGDILDALEEFGIMEAGE